MHAAEASRLASSLMDADACFRIFEDMFKAFVFTSTSLPKSKKSKHLVNIAPKNTTADHTRLCNTNIVVVVGVVVLACSSCSRDSRCTCDFDMNSGVIFYSLAVAVVIVVVVVVVKEQRSRSISTK